MMHYQWKMLQCKDTIVDKATRLQDSKQQMKHHLEETKEQQNRLRQLISNRDGKPTTKDKAQLPIPSAPKSLMNIFKRRIISAEIDLKGTKEDAIVENAEIVFYDMLIQLLHKINIEGEVVSVVTQTLDEEKSMP